MHEATVNEFPFVAELPKREKSKLARMWDDLQELSNQVDRTGILIPPGLAAELLGVSRQRVHELTKSGTLEVIKFRDRGFITENSLVAWAEAEHKTGRPVKAEEVARMGPLAGGKEFFRMSRRYLKAEVAEAVEKRRKR